MESPENKRRIPLVAYAETTPLFNLDELRQRYGKGTSGRVIRNVLYRLKRQGRVKTVATGVYSGARSTSPLDRYAVPAKLRRDAVLAFHSGLEFHGVANQVFQTVYYLSSHPRRDVVYEKVTYHRVAPPSRLVRSRRLDFQVKASRRDVRVTGRERSFVDCLLFLDYSGGVDELARSLAMFPSFDFGVALDYLRLLKKPWLYSRLGLLLDRHAEKLFFRGKWRDAFLRRVPSGVVYLERKRPGLKWVETWNLMVPASFAERRKASEEGS